MITVAYDLTSLAQSPFGGIAQVCLHTIDQAVANDHLEAYGLYRRGKRSNLDGIGCRVRRVTWTDRLIGPKPGILHALCHRIPTGRYEKLVYTLYDAWSLYTNRYQSADFQKLVGKRMRKELNRADAIACISNATRIRLLELDIVDPAVCHVATMGVADPVEVAQAVTDPKIRRMDMRPFVLFVGRIEMRKNLMHVIDAILPLGHLDLAIVGEPGYGYEEIAKTSLAAFPSERLHLFTQVDPGDLDWLYRKAVALLQPSWEEGFGLPILEAMVRGCPVITSNCSASAEVGGDAAALVNPAEASESSLILQRLTDDPVCRETMSKAGVERAKLFSWSRYFEQLMTTYRSILN